MVLFGVALCAPVHAQTVWNVSGFTSIQPAIAAASPGDILVLSDGPAFHDYEPFLLDKGLTIRGNGARIASTPYTPYGSSWIRVALPPGQVAYLENISGDAAYSGGSADVGTPIVVTSGTLFVDGYTFRGHRRGLEVSNATVVIRDSSFLSDGTAGVRPAIIANNASLTIRNSSLEGGTVSGLSFGTTPGAALVMTDSTLHAENSSFLGGGDVVLSEDGAPAIDATNSSAWLATSQLVGGSSWAGGGGTALRNAGSTTFDLVQTTLTAGSPGGLQSEGPMNFNAPMVRLDIAPRWSRGVTSTISIAGLAGAPYGLWLAPDVTATIDPVLVEPIWALNGAPVFAGILDASGMASRTVAVPNVPALEHAVVMTQAVSGVQLPLRVSAIDGAVVQ